MAAKAITFTVPLPAEQLNSSTYQDASIGGVPEGSSRPGLRVRFDLESRRLNPGDQDDDDWFDSGCSVQNVTDDHIVCACSQLSATYAGTYGTQPIPEELPAVVDLGATVAVDAVRSAGIGAILEGQTGDECNRWRTTLDE
ncbi:unnamed protein product [Prorocentrum cordatum]|uniref:GPS domain-containing protein n=1 Tax=Prorocentrum cordatum TaxID=2364126 RepID=A0ABN9V334_9DINO|nr:unnamed protein product [Polarella glacialis]